MSAAEKQSNKAANGRNGYVGQDQHSPFKGAEHCIEDHEDDHDRDGQDEHQAPRTALLAFVLTGPIQFVTRGQLHLRVNFFLWHAGTYVFIGGAAVSVFAALSGLWDAWKSSEAGTQARRTVNTHATIMVTVTVLALADIAWRLNDYHTELVTPVGIMVLSVIIALLVSLGATFGGALVYEYGFNVETAGDHPVWHTSETDVFPGHKEGSS